MDDAEHGAHGDGRRDGEDREARDSGASPGAEALASRLRQERRCQFGVRVLETRRLDVWWDRDVLHTSIYSTGT